MPRHACTSHSHGLTNCLVCMRLFLAAIVVPDALATTLHAKTEMLRDIEDASWATVSVVNLPQLYRVGHHWQLRSLTMGALIVACCSLSMHRWP